LTGNPGVGKTTVLLKVIEALKAKGYRVGGMVSREVRSCGTRVGFEILDLNGEKRGWLAHINQKTGPQVGKYHVNLQDLNSVGVEAVSKAIRKCEVVAIDEIGPMELFSEKFREAIKRAFESGKLVVGVVHWKAKDKLIEDVKRRGDAEIIGVTYENRNELHQTIIEKATQFFTPSNKKRNS
jgi:nucleoside-triphosphatase